ncbi:uncharacterized protein LOC124809428 [Hydra vulgaris]|uniref:uncharacterized protein LOC124809428 n=1 Tax=Hydra vulgaris TaxID=6087 RepID=UPI0032EA63D9
MTTSIFVKIIIHLILLVIQFKTINNNSELRMFTSSPVHSSDSDYWKKLVVFDSDEDQCSNESEVFLPLSLGPLNQKSIINDSGLMCDEDLEIFESGEETDDCSTNHEIDFVVIMFF